MSELSDLAKHQEIPFGEIDYDKYRLLRPDADILFKAMFDLSELLEGNLVYIGGQTVHRALLGFRPMRRPSNDIDVVCDTPVVSSLVSNFNGGQDFFYAPRNDELFMDYQGLPVSFVLGHVHDWQVTHQFFDDAMSFETLGRRIQVASPEYTIMMKMRRAHAMERFFGKDRYDIVCFMLAPQMRPDDLRAVDYEQVADLLFNDVTGNHVEVSAWLGSIGDYLHTLRAEEKPLFAREIASFCSAVNQRYAI